MCALAAAAAGCMCWLGPGPYISLSDWLSLRRLLLASTPVARSSSRLLVSFNCGGSARLEPCMHAAMLLQRVGSAKLFSGGCSQRWYPPCGPTFLARAWLAHSGCTGGAAALCLLVTWREEPAAHAEAVEKL
jgi:hypothetical protein